MVVLSRNHGSIERIKGVPIIYSEGLYSIELQDNLEEWEVQDAWKMLRLIKGVGPFFGIAGTLLVSGPPRQGKGLFGNVFSWKGKHYFKGKKVLRDDQAAPLFGPYTFFNEETMLADVASMSEAAGEEVERMRSKNNSRSGPKKAEAARLAKSITDWREGSGQVLLQNAIMLKDEFWKDMNKRRPMSPMNLMFGGLLKTCYHIDLMTVGIIQAYEDLDRFTCLPWVNLHAKCTWCTTVPDTTMVDFYHVRWSTNKQKLIPVAPTDKRPIRIFLNGGLPRAELNGMRYFDLFYSKAAPNLASFQQRVTPGIRLSDLGR